MNKFKFNRFIGISKVDEEKRMVYGLASTGDLDSDGEIIEPRAFEKSLPEYMKFPSLRIMHQAAVAGSTKSAELNKEGLYIGAHVTDNDSWEKVKEGDYRGFSIGGNVVKRIGNRITEVELVEISLVDVPANKKAKIEVWKSSKPQLQKDSWGVLSLSGLLGYCLDIRGMREWEGKSTKKMDKMIADLKALIVEEASEPDEIKEKASTTQDLAKLSEVETLALQIEKLESMDFSQDSAGQIADVLRKGVINSMSEQLKKAKKTEAEETKVETVETEEVETTTEEEVTEETPTETEEKSAAETNLQKLASANEAVDAIAKKKEDVLEKAEVVGLTKAVDGLVNLVTKLSSTIVDLNDRLAKVEGTPAAPKSKSVLVHKSAEDQKEKTPEFSYDLSTPLGVKKARLAQLEKMHSEQGPAAFAKNGHSREAAMLMNEVQQLEAAEAATGTK